MDEFDIIDIIAYNDIRGNFMASILIRQLDEATKAKLRIRAAYNQRSMEDEARSILRAALVDDAANPESLADAVSKRFKKLGGLDLQVPPRGPVRTPPKLR